MSQGRERAVAPFPSIQLTCGEAYSGNFSSPVDPCDDIAAGPACPSPSKGVVLVTLQALCAWSGSANQNTRWSRPSRVREPLASVLTKASAMIAST